MISHRKSELIRLNLSAWFSHIDCELIFSKRKTLSLEIVDVGKIKIRAPLRCPKKYIMDFVQSKSVWIIEKFEKFEPDLPNLSQEESSELRKITADRAKLFLTTYSGKIPKRITIKHQKTRWGSCSSNGNMSLNLNCGLLTDELFAYVMIHELAHLYEMNHSAAFWAKVEEQLPNYKELHKQLKQIPLRS